MENKLGFLGVQIVFLNRENYLFSSVMFLFVSICTHRRTNSYFHIISVNFVIWCHFWLPCICNNVPRSSQKGVLWISLYYERVMLPLGSLVLLLVFLCGWRCTLGNLFGIYPEEGPSPLTMRVLKSNLKENVFHYLAWFINAYLVLTAQLGTVC
jgi:hypothetical protein